MNAQFYKDGLGWGFALWLIGYLLGIALFAFVPASLLGWVIMPIGILITLWVLLKQVATDSLRQYAVIAITWTIIAILFDYIFLVLLLKPEDGYYKPDVYLYYALTFILPLTVGWYRNSKGASLTQ